MQGYLLLLFINKLFNLLINYLYRNVDIFMWDYPDSLIFVAAGNSGDDGVGTVGTPATNKNGVSVGATLNSRLSFKAYDILPSTNENDYDPNSLASFSSRGPTYDNRMKPDVCGVGKLFFILCYKLLILNND